MNTEFNLRCPTAERFKSNVRGLGFNASGRDQSITIRRGSIVGRFIGGGRHAKSRLTLEAQPHTTETDMDNAVADLAKAFPSMSVGVR